MVEKIITDVLQMMEGKDLKELKTALYCALSGYEITEKSTELETINNGWMKALDNFLKWKELEGRSKRTLDQYELHLIRMLAYLNTFDIKNKLVKACRVGRSNIRRYICRCP